MTRCFIDTNIWLRTILQDNDQYPVCVDFLTQVSQGQYQAYTSTIILLEIDYLLTRTFKVKKADSYLRLEAITHLPGLTVLDQTNHQEALKLYRQTHVKFTDCLIAAQIPPQTTLVTYDRDFHKIPHLSVLAPGEISPSN
jgi:predicted nucleic-acid-binding protein